MHAECGRGLASALRSSFASMPGSRAIIVPARNWPAATWRMHVHRCFPPFQSCWVQLAHLLDNAGEALNSQKTWIISTQKESSHTPLIFSLGGLGMTIIACQDLPSG